MGFFNDIIHFNQIRRDYHQAKGVTVQVETPNQYLENIMMAMVHSGWINQLDDSKDFVTNGYAGNADIYSIINYIITTASNVPFMFQRIEGDEWVTDESPLLDLINNPNPLTTRSLFIEETLGWKLISGNYYVYAPRLEAGVNQGQTLELWTMPSTDMKVVGGDIRQPIKGFTYELWQEIIPADNVLYGRYFNPLGAVNSSNRSEVLTGMSPLRAAALVATKSNSGMIAEVSAFKNNGAIGILSRDGDNGNFTREQADNIDHAWKRKNGGAEEYGKVVNTGANVKWQSMGTSPADMRIVESSLDAKRKMASVYKMPTQLLNDSDGATFSNQNEAQKSVYTNTIIPELQEMGEGFVKWLGESYHPGEKIRLVPDTSNIEVLQQDRQKQVDWLSKADWLTYNEKREVQGYEPIEGLDEPFVSSSVTRFSDLNLVSDSLMFRNEVNDSGATEE